MRNEIDIAGQKFGRLTAISFIPGSKHVLRTWVCRCDCGNMTVLPTTRLVRGITSSCGCWHREVVGRQFTTHGHTRNGKVSPELNIYAGMVGRCGNPNLAEFQHYGGRGISVCARWLDSFEAFFEDMGPRPSPSHSIDRIDVDGNYEPGNVRWATPQEQQNNRRNNRKVTYRGEVLTVAQLARKSSVSYHTLRKRLDRGWTPEDAANEPVTFVGNTKYSPARGAMRTIGMKE